MQLTLTPDIERTLSEQARMQGTTPELLVLDALRERFTPSGTSSPSDGSQETLFDFLEGHLGILSSSEYIIGGARLSEHSDKKFATGLVKKRQDGRL